MFHIKQGSVVELPRHAADSRIMLRCGCRDVRLLRWVWPRQSRRRQEKRSGQVNHTTKKVNAKGVASLTDTVSSPARLNI